MNDLEFLKLYCSSRYFPPDAKWSEKYFRKRACQIWAVNEILKKCNTSDNNMPNIRCVLEDFIDEMQSCLSSNLLNEEQILNFETSKEVGEELLNYFV